MKEEAMWVLFTVACIFIFFITLMNKYFKDE